MKKLLFIVGMVLVGWVQAKELVLTADADVDIRSASSADRGFNRDTLVICNNGDSSTKQSAKAYIRFKLPESGEKITSATFTMTRAILGSYGSRHEVYGLIDGAAERDWDESSRRGICWEDAPGNVVESPSGFRDAVQVGRFETKKAALGGQVGGRLSISGSELVNFLNEDSNGVVTLMVGRMQASSSYDQWASKENGDFSGPTLTIDTAPVSRQSVAAVPFASSLPVVGAASVRWHQWRTAQKEFPLAAWSYFHRYPGTKAEYQVYKDAGLNFVQAPRSQAANARAAGLGLVLGAFESVHEDERDLAALVAFANAHPDGAVAYSLKDEPVPADYAELGKAMAYIYAQDTSGALPIIDFRPNWAVPFDRWQMTYETCFESYVDEVDPPVLLNCHYPLMRDGGNRPIYFSNMEYFRRLALENDIGLMGFVQLTAHTFENSKEIDYREPSESDLNWLVNTHLAYGAQGLWYYNWRIKDDRFSEGMVVGETGEPTALHPMVKKVNERVQALSGTLMKLKSKGVAHTDEVVPVGTTRYARGMITGLSSFEGESFVVSEFMNQDDPTDHAVYLMIVNKRHAADTAADQLMQAVSFNVTPNYKNISQFDFDSGAFQRVEGNRVTLNLGGGEAAFLILKSF